MAGLCGLALTCIYRRGWHDDLGTQVSLITLLPGATLASHLSYIFLRLCIQVRALRLFLLRAICSLSVSLSSPADMFSTTVSHPRSILKRTSVSSTTSSDSYESTLHSAQYIHALVRAPSSRSMLTTYTAAGRLSATSMDVPPSRRRCVSFSEDDEVRFYSPLDPPHIKPPSAASRMLSEYH